MGTPWIRIANRFQKWENDAREGGWISLVGLFGPMWPQSAPRVDFCRILGFIWTVILGLKSVKICVDFRYVFWKSFGGMLEWFWGCFKWLFDTKTDDQKQKGRFVEIVVLLTQYYCFQGSWASFRVPEREKNGVRIRSGFRLGFVRILKPFWE